MTSNRKAPVKCAEKKLSIQFKNPLLEILESSERDRAVSELHLSTRAMNSLNRIGIRSIGQLARAARDGITPPRAAGRKTAADIQSALCALSEAMRPDGRIDWDLYFITRGLDPSVSEESLSRANQVGAYAVQISSPALDTLMPSCREGSLDILHPSCRACTFLRRSAVNTVGDLVDSARAGIKRLPAAGPATITEIESALRALSRSTREDGSVDWMVYAAERDFTLFPKKNYAELSPRHFLKILPEVMREAVESRYGTKESFVLQHYLLQCGRRPKTIEKLARQLDCTKQGVSLVKDKVITMLRDAILDDSYCGCRFRFRHAFVARFRQLRAALSVAQKRPLLYSEWQKIVVELWRIAPIQLKSLESFFFGILGYHMVHPSGSRFQPIILPRGKDTSPFTAALAATERLFGYHFPNGLSEQQLLAKLGRSVERGLTAEDIPAIIGSVPGIEHVKSEGRFQIRLENIVRLSDQLERFLRKKRLPMHIRELTAEIGRLRRKSGRLRTVKHISSALSCNRRFKRVGHTGYWILSEWKDFETGTVADIAAEILLQSKTSMTGGQLYPLIAARRSVGRRSIGNLLREDGRFHRVAPGTWELK